MAVCSSYSVLIRAWDIRGALDMAFSGTNYLWRRGQAEGWDGECTKESKKFVV
jgi:hypothetical protein